MRIALLTLLLGAVSVVPMATAAQAADAPAAKVATVDLQRALNEVGEGVQARARLETLHAGKKASLEQMRKQLDAQLADLEKQKLILSEQALRAKQQDLMQLDAQAQQATAAAEQEMRQAYYGAMETLIEKLKKVAAGIGAERGYTLILEVNSDAVVYAVPGTDITAEVIKRYDAANPVTTGAATPAPKAK